MCVGAGLTLGTCDSRPLFPPFFFPPKKTETSIRASNQKPQNPHHLASTRIIPQASQAIRLATAALLLQSSIWYVIRARSRGSARNSGRNSNGVGSAQFPGSFQNVRGPPCSSPRSGLPEPTARISQGTGAADPLGALARGWNGGAAPPPRHGDALRLVFLRRVLHRPP